MTDPAGNPHSTPIVPEALRQSFGITETIEHLLELPKTPQWITQVNPHIDAALAHVAIVGEALEHVNGFFEGVQCFVVRCPLPCGDAQPI